MRSPSPHGRDNGVIMGPAKRLLRAGFRSLVRIYFRSIEVVGDRPTAATSGRIFVSNHSNALLDPVLVLTHAPCDMSPLAKSTLWQIPGLKYLLDIADAVPIQRKRDDPNKPVEANDAIFEKVAQHLVAGGNVLVFPEGTSHNEPQLARLKTGAARMLARAREMGGRDLTFQAVGLEFDARSTFRSRAAVAYGPVRNVEELAEGAAAAGEFVERVTTSMRADLEDLVVEGATWDERRLVLRIAELVQNDAFQQSAGSSQTPLGFNEAVRIAQRVEQARDDLRAQHPELAARVERVVREYFEALDRAGTSDARVAGLPSETRPGAAALRALAWLGLPLFPVGVALYWVPYQLPRLVARRSDEIDQHSTLKLATGLVAYPVWAAVLSGAALVGLRSRAARTAAIATIVASPFAALHWLERTRELRSMLRVLERPAELASLRERRARALEAIAQARDVFQAIDGAATA
ncbi:MAG: 1-acyl-sn-glycerol-3-phosphate acyltransferase [Polyangiaceae bacterium]